jgi:glycosyltransferase involved in cell wall biosynthesis
MMLTGGIVPVSIVIPAYNAAPFLREAIDSVLAQTYQPVELIVIDDGSVDETPKILESYGSAIRVFRQANSGQSTALNRGWKLSNGAVLGYLSADDRLHPDAIAVILESLQQTPAAVLAYPDFDLIDESSARLRTVSTLSYDQRVLIAHCHCLPGPGILFRRQAWERAGGWNPQLHQLPDYDFFLRLSLVGSFVRVPSSLADFRVHQGSTTYRPSSFERSEEPVRVMEALFARDDLPDAVAAWRRTAMANALLLAGFRHARSGRLGSGAWRFLQALWQDPASACSMKAMSYAYSVLRICLGLSH